MHPTPDPGSTTPAQAPRPRPRRSIRWLMRPLPGGPYAGTFVITEGQEATTYFVLELVSDLGPGQRAFELTKLDPGSDPESTEYHVLLAPDGRNSCDCKGFLRWGHRTLCKHVAGMLVLLGIPPAPVASPGKP